MRIVFFVYEGLTTLDVVGPHEVLARLPGVEAVTASPDGGPVTVDTGTLGLVPTASISDIESADVLVVPGGVSGTFAAAADPAITGWVRDISAGATWTASVCTGSLILGAAGVLAGRRATTHWAAIDLLERYGAIPTRQRIVIDGDVITAAGISSGIDMALRLAAELTDDTIAQALQLAIEYDPDPPFDCGSPATAPPEIVELARAALAGDF